MNAFSSAAEFLRYIKKVEASALPRMADPDVEFQKIHQEETKDMPEEILGREEPFDWLVETLFQEIENAASGTIRAEIQERVAAGCLEHESVNAQILRSKDGYYAIVLNKGLMMLVNKFIKLIAAASEPEAVIYCNRGVAFSKQEYIQMGAEVLKHYAKHGVPAGPRLKLRADSRARGFLEVSLRWIELFILAHEVGHFANGDLANLKSFSPWHLADISVFNGEQSHREEFDADRFAFATVMRITAASTPTFPAIQVLLGAATLTFNVLRGISDRESYSHPAASARLLAITREFFGPKPADAMEASFASPRLVEDVRKAVGNVSVSALIRSWPSTI